MSDPDVALDVRAEELGVDPDGGANPFQVALASFVAFAIGALVPLLPGSSPRETPPRRGRLPWVQPLLRSSVGSSAPSPNVPEFAPPSGKSSSPCLPAVRPTLIGSVLGVSVS